MTADPSLPEVTSIASAAGWFLVRRMPDEMHPHVWHREPIAAWALISSGTQHFVAVMGDRALAPLRDAEEGRDGNDFHQHAPSAHHCTCDLPVRTERDPDWCGYCCGLAFGGRWLSGAV